MATRPALPFACGQCCGTMTRPKGAEHAVPPFADRLYLRSPVLRQPVSQLPAFREYSPTADRMRSRLTSNS